MAQEQKKAPQELVNVANYLLDIGKSGLRQRQTQFNGQRVIYFKGKSGVNALLKKEYTLNPPVSSREEAGRLLEQLLSHQFFIRCHKDPNTQNLQLIQEQEFSEDTYFMWLYQGSQIKNYLTAIGVLAVIILGVFYPLWPRFLQKGVWYLSMAMLGFLCFMLVLAVIRLILYVFTKIFVKPGIWLFPNLFEDCGFFESFVPLYAWDVPPPPKQSGGKKKKVKAGAAAVGGADAKYTTMGSGHSHDGGCCDH